MSKFTMQELVILLGMCSAAQTILEEAKCIYEPYLPETYNVYKCYYVGENSVAIDQQVERIQHLLGQLKCSIHFYIDQITEVETDDE